MSKDVQLSYEAAAAILAEHGVDECSFLSWLWEQPKKPVPWPPAEDVILRWIDRYIEAKQAGRVARVLRWLKGTNV